MANGGFFMIGKDFFGVMVFEDYSLTSLYTFLVYLADWRTGIYTGSMKLLVDTTKMPRMTLHRKLRLLEKEGMIKWEIGSNQHMSTKITMLKYFDFYRETTGKAYRDPNGGPSGYPLGHPDHEANDCKDYTKSCVINDGGKVDDKVDDKVDEMVDGKVGGCSNLLEENKIKKRRKKEKINTFKSPPAISPDDHIIDPKATAKTAGSRVFLAYSESYQAAYGQEPVRNAKQNAHCARIVARLGEEAALETTRYYLTHRKRWYVDSGHCLAALEKDCEALDVQRRKGMQMTETLSRQIDKDSALDDVVRRFNERHKGERTSGK
jgi:hypothetical protein